MRKRIVNFAFGAVLVLLAVFVTVRSYIPDNFDVKVGDICPEDIFATGEIVDEVSTEKLRRSAEELVQPNYKIDASKTAQCQTAAEEAAEEKFGNDEKIISAAKKAVEIIMSEAVTADNIDKKRASAASELKKLGVSEEDSDELSVIVGGAIAVNTVIDAESYETAKKEAAQKVEPVVYR
ncbi:MAG: hypothetical protein SPL89_00490, partial [Clostridia bacterium]|nr:hypothetical protein [Clostridia bacterium]